MRQLIVTGDDFGVSLAVNEAIEQAHSHGILNTTSLMVGSPGAADAVQRARRLPGLKVGLHVVVVCGQPLLPASWVPALVDSSGNFSARLGHAGVNFFFRPAARRQLASEIRAQFEAFAATGLVLDHVNAHNHMHVHPTVLGLILRIGRDFGLRAVRLPFEPFLPAWSTSGSQGTAVLLKPWLALMRWRIRRGGLRCNDYLFGMSDTGAMTVSRVLALLPQLPVGVSEVYFHPAVRDWPDKDPAMKDYACEQELDALTNPAVAHALHAAGITSASFGKLA